MIDGVFEPQQGDEEALRFREAVLTDADAPWVQARVRQRVLRWFARQGYLDKDDAKDMAQWSSGGGFSVGDSVRIEANDRPGLKRLLRYLPPRPLNRCVSVFFRLNPADFLTYAKVRFPYLCVALNYVKLGVFRCLEPVPLGHRGRQMERALHIVFRFSAIALVTPEVEILAKAAILRIAP